MTREEILTVAKPILFNTEMVRAIKDNRKTVTRRAVKPQPPAGAYVSNHYGDTWTWARWPDSQYNRLIKNIYYLGDILYVREAWRKDVGRYMYKANYSNGEKFYRDGKNVTIKWHPSIHMPKEAARLFLRVTGLRAERLQDIFDDPPGSENQIVKEGCKYGCDFIAVWDRTIKPADRSVYGWDANPWVWAIEFERVEAENA